MLVWTMPPRPAFGHPRHVLSEMTISGDYPVHSSPCNSGGFGIDADLELKPAREVDCPSCRAWLAENGVDLS